MVKSLNEMAENLKEFIVDNDLPKDSGAFGWQRFNNLKLTMDVSESTPHVKINIAISEAKFNILTGEKMEGSLGPEEKFTARWLGKPLVMPTLNEIWKIKKLNRTKMVIKEDADTKSGSENS